MDDFHKKKQRWSVTYTKHIKQKRKIYQDGFLDLLFSTNKVMLFDEFEKLLECRILKDEEIVNSGETLTFNAFLVDIGDPEGGDYSDSLNKTAVSNFNLRGRDGKITERPRLIRRQKFQSPSISASSDRGNVEKNDACTDCLSASRKVIREFKKNEMQKHGVPQGSPETAKTTTEWQVLYSTQVTQKAKKYHDGFLQLAACGSLPRQVMLYDAERKLLTSRFLELDEIVRSGGSLSIYGYLVDIGALEGDHKPYMDLNIQKNPCTMAGKAKTMQEPQNFKSNISGGKEWQVLYTTHITQKAKKYHDGFLRLENCGSLGRQIMLYDANKKCLDCRYLKKDETISSGESISFDAHLVDIGESEEENHLPEYMNVQKNNSNDVGKVGMVHGHTSCLNTNKSVGKEWHALYSSQITKKAKKYHSGILRLAPCGFYCMQVTLLDENKTKLCSKFLGLSEDVKTGAKLALPNYLVEVGEPFVIPEEKCQDNACSTEAANSTFSTSSAEEIKLFKINSTTNPLQNGKYQNNSCLRGREDSTSISVPKMNKSSNIFLPNKPLRNAYQILSILQKPIVQGSVAVKCTDKSINPLIDLSEDCQLPTGSLAHQGPSQNMNSGGSSKIVDIEEFAGLNSSKVMSSSCVSQFPDDTEAAENSDQFNPVNMVVDGKWCEEAFSSGNSSLLGACAPQSPHDDKRKSIEELTGKMDEWPTFDLGL